MRSVAVVIPTLNEEESVGEAIASARRAGAAEVVVADGGSTDRTVEIARADRVLVVESEPIRGRQLNAGAESTRSDILVFLHADTVLPEDAVTRMEAAIASGAIFGGFRISFAESNRRLRLASAMINMRCMISRCPWGDQAQWIIREQFESSGGYREDPIMEDYEMALRMKRRGRTAILSSAVTTSGRRFLQKGLLRTAFINWRVVVAWRLGTAPERLAAIYRG